MVEPLVAGHFLVCPVCGLKAHIPDSPTDTSGFTHTIKNDVEPPLLICGADAWVFAEWKDGEWRRREMKEIDIMEVASRRLRTRELSIWDCPVVECIALHVDYGTLNGVSYEEARRIVKVFSGILESKEQKYD